jgi:hypothetical protein
MNDIGYSYNYRNFPYYVHTSNEIIKIDHQNGGYKRYTKLKIPLPKSQQEQLLEMQRQREQQQEQLLEIQRQREQQQEQLLEIPKPKSQQQESTHEIRGPKFNLNEFIKKITNEELKNEIKDKINILESKKYFIYVDDTIDDYIIENYNKFDDDFCIELLHTLLCLVDILEYRISCENYDDSPLCKNINKYIINFAFLKKIDDNDYYSLIQILTNGININNIADSVIRTKKMEVIDSIISKNSSIDKLEQIYKKYIDYENNNDKNIEDVYCVFLIFTLIEEYLNNDVGSNSESMVAMFDIFNFYILNRNKSSIRSDIFVKILLEFSLYFQYYKKNKRKYQIHNINSENHSMKLILYKNEEDEYYCVFINSGKGIEYNNNNIFLVRKTTKIDDINTLVKQSHDKTIKEIYDKFVSITENDDLMNQNIAEFELKYCSKQLSGSCTYYSALYSLYYIFFDNFDENQVGDIINLYNNSLKEIVLDLLSQGTYNNIIKIKNPENQIMFNNCLHVVDNKYNLNTHKLIVTSTKTIKTQNIYIEQNKFQLLSKINNTNVIISSHNTIHINNDYQDVVSYELMLKHIKKNDKIDIIPFLLYLSFTISISNHKYNDRRTKESILTLINFYDNLDFNIDILNFNKFIFLILHLLFHPVHDKYEINSIMHGYIFLMLFNTFEHLEFTYDKLFLLEKTDSALIERNKITSDMLNFFYPTNKLYIDASRLFNKYFHLIDDLIQGDNLKFDNITNYDYDIIICKLFNKKYYNVAPHIIDLTNDDLDNIYYIHYDYENKIYYLNTDSDIIDNNYMFKKNNFYLFNKNNEFDQFNSQNFSIKSKGNIPLSSYINGLFDNNNNNDNINNYYLVHLNNSMSKSTIHNLINNDNLNDNNNQNKVKELSWINPFKLKISDMNDDEKFSYILNNVNYLFLPKVIENDDYNVNFYGNYVNNENNFYAINRQVFITNFNNLNFDDMIKKQILNEKILFIVYIFHLFFEIKNNEITNSNNYNVMIKNAKKHCNNDIFYSIFFESKESINANNITKYVDEILKLQNYINFVDYIILHQIISNIYHDFKRREEIKLIISNLVLSDNKEYDYEYEYENEKYITSYRLIHEFHNESNLIKYIKFTKISDNTEHYISGLYPRLIKNGSDYFLYNKPEYKYDKELTKISLGNKKSIYGFKNTKYENNYIYYYSNCKNDEKIYYETIINGKVYIFDDIEQINDYSPYLGNYEILIDSENESVNSLIVSNKKMYFFINKKRHEYGLKYTHIFGIDNTDLINNINQKINILFIQNNYKDENLFFEYDITMDTNNKIIDIEFDTELSGLLLFLILNKNYCYELIINLMNKFASKLEINDFCLYINHPYSYLFTYKLLNICYGLEAVTHWLHDGTNLYQIEDGNKKYYKKSNNCKELLGLLDTDFSDGFCMGVIGCIFSRKNIKFCYDNYLSYYIEYLFTTIIENIHMSKHFIQKIDPYIIKQLLEFFNYDDNTNLEYWYDNFIDDDNIIPDGWDLTFKHTIKNNRTIDYLIKILYLYHSHNLKNFTNQNNNTPPYTLSINMTNFDDNDYYKTIHKIDKFRQNYEKYLMVYHRRKNDKNKFNSEKILISIGDIDKNKFDEYYVSVDNLTYKDKQKQIIDEINNYISDLENLSNPMYEIMMGFGKSKVIIPYISLYTFLFNSYYQQIVIIVPKNLVNEMYNNILYRTKNMPLCMVKKQDEYSIENNNYLLEKYFKVILIISDVTLKHQLLIQSTQTSNDKRPKQFLFNHSHSRFCIIDEIDDCINPLKSNFNLKMNESTIKTEIPEYCDLFFSFMIDYIKKISTIVNCDNINIIIKEFFSEHMDVLECICQNKNVNGSIKDNCQGFINSDEKAKILYILEKIYNATKILKKYIKNRHYGFDKVKNKRYFYAIPYIAIDTPSDDSEFNDIYTIMILTINLYLNDDFSLRDEDIKKITSFVLYNDIDIPSEKIDFVELCYDYNNIDNKRKYKNNDFFKNKIEELGLSKYLIELYLLKIILPDINFTIEYKNTSFLELLNPHISHKYISFSGTTEFVGKINNEYPKIYSKNIVSYNNNYSTRWIDYPVIKSKFFDNINFADLSEDSLYNYINDNNDKNPRRINCIIDTGCIFRFKQNKNYAKEILSKIKGVKYVLFYDNNDILYRCALNYDGVIFTLENTIKNNEELEIMSKEMYFIFFDEKHIRGSDINLPLNTHGLVTVTHINNSVNIMQGIYRLRQIGRGQTVEFIINKNLENDVNYKGLWDYIKKNTNIYMEEQEKELVIQTILANQKFLSYVHPGYFNIKIKLDFLPDYIYTSDINDIMKFDFNTKKIIDFYVNHDIFSIDYIEQYYDLILKYIKNKKFDDSTSVSLGLSLSLSHSIDINISKYIPIEINEKYRMNTRIPTNNDWLAIYNYKKNNHTYFSFYSYAYLNNELIKFYEQNEITEETTNKKQKYKQKYNKYLQKIQEINT